MIYGKIGAISCINSNNEVDSTHYPHNNIAHLSANSARYNGILSISATGVDNGKGGGWEKIRGPHGGILIMFIHFIIKYNNDKYIILLNSRSET